MIPNMLTGEASPNYIRCCVDLHGSPRFRMEVEVEVDVGGESRSVIAIDPDHWKLEAYSLISAGEANNNERNVSPALVSIWTTAQAANETRHVADACHHR